MRTLLVAAVLVVFGCKNKPASRSSDPVVERLNKAVVTAFPGSTTNIQPDDVLVISGGAGSGVHITLDNIRRSCATSETECANSIKSVVENIKKASLVDADAPLDKTRIRLTPKPTEWLDAADASAREAPNANGSLIVRQKFAGDLWWVYVVNEPNGMQIISEAMLKQLGMTVEQLHALAVANLAAQYPNLELAELGPGTWTIKDGDVFDSARLALTDQWRAAATRLGGTLIASAPARALVFVCNDPKQRGRFDEITARGFAEEDHPLSPMVLIWTATGWQAERSPNGSAAPQTDIKPRRAP